MRKAAMSAMRTVLCAIAATGLALGGALPADAAQLHDVNMDAVTQVRSISGTDGAENTMPAILKRSCRIQSRRASPMMRKSCPKTMR